MGHISQEEGFLLSRFPGALGLLAQLILLVHQVANVSPYTEGT